MCKALAALRCRGVVPIQSAGGVLYLFVEKDLVVTSCNYPVNESKLLSQACGIANANNNTNLTFVQYCEVVTV